MTNAKSALSIGVLLTLFGSAILVFADHSININTADKAALMTLTGIGEVKSEDIIAYREAYGPFAAIEEIKNVSGIGDATFNNIKDHITVGGSVGEVTQEAPAEVQSGSGGTNATTDTPSSPSFLSRVSVGNDRSVTRGIAAQFEVNAYDSANRSVEAEFKWNFGDGSSAIGKKVSHMWHYPGRYAVVVEASRFSEKATHRITVTVHEPELALETFQDGGVAIENLAPRDIDLSGWRIAERGMTFVFPANTILLRGESLRLSPSRSGFFAGVGTSLQYPDGQPFTIVPEPEPESSASEAPLTFTNEENVSEPIEEAMTVVAEESETAEVLDNTAVEEVPEPEAPIGEVELTAAVSSAEASSRLPLLWWVGLALIIILGAYAVFAARRLRCRAWTIIEDREE